MSMLLRVKTLDHAQSPVTGATTISFEEMYEHDFYVEEDEDIRKSRRKTRWELSSLQGLSREAEPSADMNDVRYMLAQYCTPT
jgi:hypothetical protein